MSYTASQAVGATSYPGRGILVGRSADGDRAIMAYFIMGRSENSRNRVFVMESDGIRTQAHDPSKMEDPSLIIYAPVRTLGNRVIITNGDQTDTIHRFLSEGATFADALRTRTFEPDAPNYTPRISALVTFDDGDLRLDMSILRAGDSRGSCCHRVFWEYERVTPGTGYFLHTYTGRPELPQKPRPESMPFTPAFIEAYQKADTALHPFVGDPEEVLFNDANCGLIAEALWHRLDADNRVSLWVQTRSLSTGAVERVIFNARS